MPVANTAMSKMNYLWKSGAAGLTGLPVMTAFETTKSIAFTHLTLWQSHAITIVFCTALVFILSAVFLKGEQGKVKASIGLSDGIVGAEHESDLLEAQRIAGIGSFLWTLATGTQKWSLGMKRILRRDPDLPTPTFEGCRGSTRRKVGKG